LAKPVTIFKERYIATMFTARNLDNEEIGSVSISEFEDRSGLFLYGLLVLKDYRQHGIGRNLMARLIEDFGHKDIYLKPDAYNDKPMTDDQLKRFYTSFGFEVFSGNSQYMIRKATKQNGN
jgi:ribosomal protein S18 acetylase RimI-like enzyme